MPRCAKRCPFWQAFTVLRRLVGRARNGNLSRRAFHELAARKLFHKVVVDGTRTQQFDAVRQTRARPLKLSELLLLNAEPSLGIGQRQKAAFAPDCVVAEIGDEGARDRRQHGNAEDTRHATPDSHALNESRTDSAGQEEIARIDALLS